MIKSKPIRMSMQTRQNWLIDAAVFVGGLVAALTGIYFLYLPSGGYQGGRNPMYGITILFDRHTWTDLHLWSGVLMIAAIAVHFAIHWQWVRRMGGRTVSAMRAEGSKLSRGAKFNVAVNLLIAISFLFCALSGIYFLFGPSGGYQGGNNPAYDPGFLFSRTTWDLIHTWSGVVMIVAAVVHFAIHWRWVKNVTVRFFLSLLPQPESGRAPVAGEAVLASSDRV
jgi:cytochrome b subunit of formate dehydrogenase